jgi:hypothetical protein
MLYPFAMVARGEFRLRRRSSSTEVRATHGELVEQLRSKNMDSVVSLTRPAFRNGCQDTSNSAISFTSGPASAETGVLLKAELEVQLTLGIPVCADHTYF